MAWRDKFKQCTPIQRQWAIARLNAKSDAAAARQVGVTVVTVNNWPQYVHDVVREALEEEFEASLEILRAALPRAAAVKVAGLDSTKASLRQNTATEIIERFHGKPVQAINANVTADVAVKGYVSISPDDWDIDSTVSPAGVAGGAVERQEPDPTAHG